MKKYVECRVVATTPLPGRQEPRGAPSQLAVVARQSSQGRGTQLSRASLQSSESFAGGPKTAAQNMLFNQAYGRRSIPTGSLLNMAV